MNALRGAFDLQTYGILCIFLITLHNDKGFRKIIRLHDEPMTLERLSRGLLDSALNSNAAKSSILVKVLDILKSELDNHSHSKFQGSYGLLQYKPTAIDEVYKVICSIDDEWYGQHQTNLVEDIILWIADNSGKAAAEFIQPVEITKLAASICGYKGHGSVYNPYAGSASYAAEMCPKNDYVGEEINIHTWVIGILRMLAHGLDTEMLSVRDSYRNWSGVDPISGEGRKFDYIIATPPFSMILPNVDKAIDPFRSFRHIEEDFLYRGAFSLKENGVLTGIFPTGITYRETPAEKELRKELVDNGLVSKVILLPDNIFFGCSIPSVLIQLRNGESDRNITMMDASSYFNKQKRRNILAWEDILHALHDEDKKHVRNVSSEDVANNGYSLFPPKYFFEEEVAPDGYVSFKVSNVLSTYNSSPVQGYDNKGHMISPANLSKEPFGKSLEVSSLSYGEMKSGYSKATSPFIAISKTNSLRPTIVNASQESPVFIGGNVAAFSFKEENIFMPLFLYEWRRISDALPEMGTTIKRKSIKDALEIVLHLPATLEEQQQLYNRLEQQYILAKARELGLEETIEAQKKDFANIFRNRKHDLKNCLGAAQQNYSALSKALKKIKIEDNNLVDIPLSDKVPITIGEQLYKLKQLLDKMSCQIDHFTDEKVFGEDEKVDLKEKLDSIQSHGNYSVVHETDLASMPNEDDSIFNPNAFARINSLDLDRVIDNIIRNAEKHGFKDPNLRYTLKVSLSYDYSDNMYAVEFQNNGLPMPKGMDTLRYGIDGERGQESDGLGKGGSIVKSIVEHFKGKYEVFNEPESPFPVGILIKLPKYDD